MSKSLARRNKTASGRSSTEDTGTALPYPEYVCVQRRPAKYSAGAALCVSRPRGTTRSARRTYSGAGGSCFGLPRPLRLLKNISAIKPHPMTREKNVPRPKAIQPCLSITASPLAFRIHFEHFSLNRGITDMDATAVSDAAPRGASILPRQLAACHARPAARWHLTVIWTPAFVNPSAVSSKHRGPCNAYRGRD